MQIVDRILLHPKYIKYMELNSEAEKDRKFCKHDLSHAFDVARVAYIMSLEKNLPIKKETIYAAALLHDIAKWKQYAEGVDHATESSVLSEEILKDVGVSNKDADEIRKAIITHRKKDIQKTILGEILYDSDKACRPCVYCKSVDECNWYTNGKKPESRY